MQCGVSRVLNTVQAATFLPISPSPCWEYGNSVMYILRAPPPKTSQRVQEGSVPLETGAWHNKIKSVKPKTFSSYVLTPVLERVHKPPVRLDGRKDTFIIYANSLCPPPILVLLHPLRCLRACGQTAFRVPNTRSEHSPSPRLSSLVHTLDPGVPFSAKVYCACLLPDPNQGAVTLTIKCTTQFADCADLWGPPFWLSGLSVCHVPAKETKKSCGRDPTPSLGRTPARITGRGSRCTVASLADHASCSAP